MSESTVTEQAKTGYFDHEKWDVYRAALEFICVKLPEQESSGRDEVNAKTPGRRDAGKMDIYTLCAFASQRLCVDFFGKQRFDSVTVSVSHGILYKVEFMRTYVGY